MGVKLNRSQMVGSEIIVVGGGIIGLRIATELSARGQSVGLVSDGGARASDASLVWLNVISTEARDYAMLRVASMKLWASIIARDESCPVTVKGALLWDRDRTALEALAEFQTDVGWETEVIDRAAFQKLAP